MTDSEKTSSGSERSQPKYAHPKIMLIDLPMGAAEKLRTAGYNVRTGTFGQPYRVPVSDGYLPATFEAHLPNYIEQEIVVVDLEPPKPAPEPLGEKQLSPGEEDVWAKQNVGVIDARPRVMMMTRAKLERIYEYGGILVVFAAPASITEFVRGYIWAGSLQVVTSLDWDTWDLLSILGDFSVTAEVGTELVEPVSGGSLFLTKHLDEANFSCTFHPPAYRQSDWVTLATSKYEDPVAGVLGPEETGKGWIVLLPRVADPGELLADLVTTLLPRLTPKLFPFHEGDAWTRRGEYELRPVLEIRTEIEEVQRRARERVGELEQAIEEERHRSEYMHDLVTRHGTELVDAVTKALRVLGFQDVRDVDKEQEAKGDAKDKREDLQIWDASPTLLVEVKGIGGLPKEAESLQVVKYVLPRVREWNRLDVQGLSIINHQKYLPGLDREHRSVFQPDVLTNAEKECGLLTAWDLFRLVRCASRHGWPPETLKPLFYKKGRIDPIPTNFTFIGVVEHYWEKAGAFSIALEAPLRLGETLAIEGPIDFEMQTVDSLRLKNVDVEEGKPGQIVGLKTSLPKSHLRPGMRIFRVAPQ